MNVLGDECRGDECRTIAFALSCIDVVLAIVTLQCTGASSKKVPACIGPYLRWVM